jgi:pimeloyl-ACP methyl ester carboxylesterase
MVSPADLTDIVSELRSPTRWYAKLLAAVGGLLFLLLLVSGAVGAYLVYRIVAPVKIGETVDLANLPGRPQVFSYEVAGLGEQSGWFFPGLKSAPTIVLCPGYGSSREELLPLATGLQDHGYNVLLFDFAGRGPDARYSTTLGFREVGELRAAISAIAERQDVDRSRFGLWGTNLGAYAAVAVAEGDSRVRALAVESVYDRPQDWLSLLLARYGTISLPFFQRLAVQTFLVFNSKYRPAQPLSAGAARLGDGQKLFLEATDEPALVGSTHELFVLAPGPKEEVLLTHGNYQEMLDEDKRTYENRIISFFLLNLPR